MRLWQKAIILLFCVLPIGWSQTGRPNRERAGAVHFSTTGYTDLGTWSANVSYSPAAWKPGEVVTVDTTLTIDEKHLSSIIASNIKVDGFVLLVTAERTFDADGVLRLPSDEKMSTLLTPTSLAIEGGVQGAVTNRFGYGFRTPVDQLVTVPLAQAVKLNGQRQVSFNSQCVLPKTVPPGIYRLRLDYGVSQGKTYYNLDAQAFAKRPTFKGPPIESQVYSPPVRVSGTHVSGRLVDASTIKPRIPWVLLWSYNSNGYQGVVSDEDRFKFALSNRLIIPDDVILPLYNDTGGALTYSLEPQFPTDTIELRNNIPWDFTKGQLSVQVTGPNGKTTNLGAFPFVGNNGQWPATKNAAVTAWKPSSFGGYGFYTVTATGWISDIWGNQYQGGGTYHFWIAKRMTMATATFQGFAYPVGNHYGRDMAFAPMQPANVQFDAYLFPNSDTSNPRHVSSSGTASLGGVYGAAQGMTPLTFDVPGEYYAHVLATYTDKNGDFWVSSMRHAGVVYPTNCPIVARGKKLVIPSTGAIVVQGNTNTEGYIDESTYTEHLQHINFPYQSGDVLLIASDHQGANKIIPNLNYEAAVNPAPYDTTLATIGASNLKLNTSNGLSPHLFPEYITDWLYYYAGAPRPGFMSRFLVAEDGTRTPYWPVSPNSFGGQVNASNNGDMPGDIYRLVGGVVVRKGGQTPMYAGYLSNAFLIPRGTNNNRIIAAGSEDITASDQSKGRFFLVGTRPGMLYTVGMTFTPAVQVDPVVPAALTFTLTYPDGRTAISQGPPDVTGSWAGTGSVLDIPGIYHFQLTGLWQGFQGRMPGLPPQGGDFYVVETLRPPNPTLQLNLQPQTTFDVTKGITITGTSTAKSVYYAAVIPGAVIAQGNLDVQPNGTFSLFFDPSAINAAFPTYDTTNMVSGNREVFDVVHLTFFSQEQPLGMPAYHAFIRLIIRGNKVIYARQQ